MRKLMREDQKFQAQRLRRNAKALVSLYDAGNITKSFFDQELNKLADAWERNKKLGGF